MSIEPDTKDWTWVLRRACPQCGFDPAAWPRAGLAAAFRANAAGWRAVLTADGPARPLHERPADGVWSPVEYACHVRDVYRLFHGRAAAMLTKEGSTFADWDQNRAAVEGGYGSAEPERVAAELECSAHALAELYDGVDEAGWGRTGRRGDGAPFTVESLGRYALHDVHHHLRDVAGAEA